MSPASDPHDPAHDQARRDALTLAALGEPLDPAFASHERDCLRCQADLRGLSETVALARGGVSPAPAGDVRPPAAVWSGIARELGFADAAAPPATGSPTPPGPPAIPPVSLDDARRRRRRRSWLAVAAAVLVLGGGAGGWLVGHEDRDVGGCPTATADLTSVGGTAADAGGRAQVVCSADGPALQVTTERLPLQSGYYEVWMYQPASGVMVAIGALGNDGAGTFTLPGGMDIREYPVVDVSAQRFDGDPTHQRSVLQGPLTR